MYSKVLHYGWSTVFFHTFAKYSEHLTGSVYEVGMVALSLSYSDAIECWSLGPCKIPASNLYGRFFNHVSIKDFG